MRKAFDANVPKFRPRLKSGVASEEAARAEPAPSAPHEEVDAAAANAPPPDPAPRDAAPETAAAADGAVANGAQAHAPVTEPVPLALSVPRDEPPPSPTGAERAAQPSPAAAADQPSQHRERPSTTPASQPSSSRAGETAQGVHRDERHEVPSAPFAPSPHASASAAGQPPQPRDGAQAGPPAAEPGPGFPFDESPDVQARRERLLQVKRKVAAAARPTPAMPALPEAPARAGESALALVRDLEGQLQRARDVEAALRTDLDQARAELARGAAESRRTVERLSAMEQQVEEKRGVLQEMLAEMSALEEERDGAVGRAQALTALDEERQALLDGLSARAEHAEKGRAEAQAEVDRLGDELDERAADAARLRAALAQVTRERDELARELGDARRELAELAEARKALEQVHEALATARARLG